MFVCKKFLFILCLIVESFLRNLKLFGGNCKDEKELNEERDVKWFYKMILLG